MSGQPETLGKYTIERELGSGGFGAVYLGRDPQLGEPVAIKMFKLRDPSVVDKMTVSTGDAATVLRERFKQEARTLRRLSNNPYVIDLYDFDETEDGTPFYVMPYLLKSLRDEIGKDLQDARVIAEAPVEDRPRALPLPRVRLILDQLLSALSEVHRAGLIHRDIKPANILFNEAGDVQLTDFGIAKVPDTEHSASGVAMGSLRYMAPEQQESAKHVDASADIYAVGVLAYRMITGTLPIGMFQPPIQLVPAVGEELNELVVSCMAQQAAQRPQNATDLLRKLREIDSGDDGLSEHSMTMPGGALPGLRDELTPLRTRIEEILREHLEVPEGERDALYVLGAVVDLSEEDVDALVDETANALSGQLGPRIRLRQQIRDRVPASGELPDSIRDAFVQGARGLGLDEQWVDTQVQLAAADPTTGPQGPGDDDEPEPGPEPPTKVRSRSDRKSPGLAIAAGVVLALVMGGGGWFLLGGSDGEPTGDEGVDVAESPAPARTAPRTTSGTTSGAISGTGTGGADATSGSGSDEDAPVASASSAAAPSAETEALVAQIEADIEASRLTSPAGNNALERIRLLEDQDTESAARMRIEVVRAYLRLIDSALATSDAPRARSLLDRAATLEVAGLDSELAAARRQIENLESRSSTVVRGRQFRDGLRSGGQGPLVAAIAPGTMTIGCVSRQQCYEDDRATASVNVASEFAIGVHEVTFADYDRFTGATGRRAADDEGRGRGNRAVVNVSWADATAYVQWLSSETGQTYRLPTEAEWEFAARAHVVTPFPEGANENGVCRYGNVADQTAARFEPGWTVAGCNDGQHGAVGVGSYAANPFGLYDVVGNVWEWTEDCWYDSHSGRPRDASARGSSTGYPCDNRVVRGGSWRSTSIGFRLASRDRMGSFNRFDDVGFRVARDL